MDGDSYKDLCRTILNTIEESVVVFDKNLVVMNYNQQFQAVFEGAQTRFKTEEILGKALPNIFPSLNRIRHHIDLCIRTGKKQRFHAFCPLHQKLTHYTIAKVLDYYTALFYPLPENIAQMVQSFTASKSYVRLILDGCPFPVITVDEDGNIMEWNGATEEMFGWSRAEVLYRTIWEVIFPQGNDSFMNTFYNVSESEIADLMSAETTRTTTLVTDALKKDKTSTKIEINLTRSKYEGSVIHIIYIRDTPVT